MQGQLMVGGGLFIFSYFPLLGFCLALSSRGVRLYMSMDFHPHLQKNSG